MAIISLLDGFIISGILVPFSILNPYLYLAGVTDITTGSNPGLSQWILYCHSRLRRCVLFLHCSHVFHPTLYFLTPLPCLSPVYPPFGLHTHSYDRVLGDLYYILFL